MLASALMIIRKCSVLVIMEMPTKWRTNPDSHASILHPKITMSQLSISFLLLCQKNILFLSIFLMVQKKRNGSGTRGAGQCGGVPASNGKKAKSEKSAGAGGHAKVSLNFCFVSFLLIYSPNYKIMHLLFNLKSKNCGVNLLFDCLTVCLGG